MAVINVTPINKTDAENFPKKMLKFPVKIFRVHICLTESSGTFIELFMITIQWSA